MKNEITVIQDTALGWAEKATQIVVKDQESYDVAANTLKAIARMEKQIKEHHSPIKKAAKEAHNMAVKAEKKFLEPLDEAKRIIQNSIVAWTTEQERIRANAERKAKEEARKKEEEERIAIAEKAESEGKSEIEVEEILDTPTQITPVVVDTPKIKKVEGVSTRKTWSAKVVDIQLLCRAVADNKIPSEAVFANMTFLNSMARISKDSLEIPGVIAVENTGISIRS